MLHQYIEDWITYKNFNLMEPCLQFSPWNLVGPFWIWKQNNLFIWIYNSKYHLSAYKIIPFKWTITHHKQIVTTCKELTKATLLHSHMWIAHLSDRHPDFQDFSIARQHFVRCMNFQVVNFFSLFLQTSKDSDYIDRCESHIDIIFVRVIPLMLFSHSKSQVFFSLQLLKSEQ